MPPPFTVTVAVRSVLPVLAVTFTVTVPPLLPLFGLTVHQLWSLLTSHETLLSMLNDLLPASFLVKATVVLVFLSTVRKASPACVTVTVRVMPPPFTVTLAVRSVLPVLAVTFTVTVPPLLPLFGLTVHQFWSLLTSHETLLCMLKVLLSASFLVKSTVVLVALLTVRKAPLPGCVTFTLHVRFPLLTVTTAGRESLSSFFSATMVISPSLLCCSGLTLHQFLSLVAFQVTFDSTLNFTLSFSLFLNTWLIVVFLSSPIVSLSPALA